MTLPNERTAAVRHTRYFLRTLLDPKKTPRVAKKIRHEAYWCLRHFPWDLDLHESALKAPRVWGRVWTEQPEESIRLKKKSKR